MSDTKQCWECVKRRLVCDFGRPGCKKCLSRRVECPGYGTKKPVTWLQPNQTRSKGVRSKKEAQSIMPAFKDCSETTDVIEATRYFNAHICPDLVANGAGGGFRCPFMLHPEEAPYVPAAARRTIVSIALAHRILKSEQGFESDQMALSKRLQRHRGEAIRHLAADLGPESEPTDYTLASILTFLLAEIQQSFSTDWRQHCDAANACIDSSGGMIGLIFCRPFQRPLVRYLLLIEIMSSTTAPFVEEDRVRRQVEVLPFIHGVFCVGLYTSVPCPPELLADIIRVNNLQSQSQAGGEHMSQFERRSSSLELLRKIKNFSSEIWAADIIMNEQKNEDPRKPFTQRQALSWDWQAIAHVYQYSVTLYCISCLFYPHYTGAAAPVTLDRFDIGELRSVYLGALLRDLKKITSDPMSQLRKFVTWPLVIAGIEVDVNDHASKTFISAELVQISRTLGMASPLVAQTFLSNVWKSEWIPSGYKRAGWNSIFDKPYIFMM